MSRVVDNKAQQFEITYQLTCKKMIQPTKFITLTQETIILILLPLQISNQVSKYQ